MPRHIARAVVGLALWSLACAGVTAEPAASAASKPRNPMAELAWQKGPASLLLGTKASLKVPEQHAALSESESAKFLALTGNLPDGGVNILAGSQWWATFEFADSGYVKDDDKIDADALLQQIKDSDEGANAERRKQGLAELVTDGWSVPPHYDAESKRLEWGLKLHALNDPRPVINYTVRLLGRSGYERAVLVTSPETLDKDVVEFKAALKGFSFAEGERYGEFRPGDRVAEFGLAALVAGGAAAVAAKTGFWKVIVGFLAAGWKFIAVGAVALVAGLRRLMGRKDSTG